MATAETIQLPSDATENKNLLRAFVVNVPDSDGNTDTTLHQVIALGDADGNVVSAWNGLATSDAETRGLLRAISSKLDILIGIMGG